MEHLCKRTNEKKLLKLTSKPTYVSSKIFNENLVAVHKIKETLTLNRPAYVGMCILDLSKTLMYDFHYNYINPILPGLLNTLQTREGGIFTPLLIHLFFILEAYNLACRVLLVISFDFNFKICEILMYDVTVTSFLCFCRRNGLKANNVIMTSN